MRAYAGTVISVSLLLLLPAVTSAEVRLPAIISDHMVLQRGLNCPIWGWAAPNENVVVTVLDAAGGTVATSSAVAPADGKWMLRLALPGGGPFQMTVAGVNTLTISDVLVGEVWVASGQSNMSYPVSKAADATREIAAANYPQIRMFKTSYRWTDEPQADTEGQWKVCTPELAGEFSAVGYFFARSLHKTLGLPVGIINSSVGGTAIEGWTPRQTIDRTDSLRIVLENHKEALAKYRETLERYEREHQQWQATTQQSTQPSSMPAEPKRPMNPAESASRPCALYNGKIAPVVPYGIRGVIWYQGEGNNHFHDLYRVLFPAMIQGWRQAWGQGDFPFLFVQLPRYDVAQAEMLPFHDSWPLLREAQESALALPHTAMAVTIDLGEPDNVHPVNKQDVGRRLALLALHDVYQKDGVPATGPRARSVTMEGSRARIVFGHADGGLRALVQAPLTVGTLSTDLPAMSPAERVEGFAVAGDSGAFVSAQAEIQGNSVIVWSDAVPKPAAVRYGWDDNPCCNLYNAAGLPAAPFRTDGSK